MYLAGGRHPVSFPGIRPHHLLNCLPRPQELNRDKGEQPNGKRTCNYTQGGQGNPGEVNEQDRTGKRPRSRRGDKCRAEHSAFAKKAGLESTTIAVFGTLSLRHQDATSDSPGNDPPLSFSLSKAAPAQSLSICHRPAGRKTLPATSFQFYLLSN